MDENINENHQEPTGDNLVKTLVIQLPPFPIARKSTRLGKAGIIITGGTVTQGSYNLRMINRENYTGILITPIHRKVRTFWTFNGHGTRVQDTVTSPRVPVPIIYFLWELKTGVHHQNAKLPKSIITLLDKVKELLLD